MLARKYQSRNAMTAGVLKKNKIHWKCRMKKLLVLCQAALTVSLFIAIPLALGEEQRYVSSFPPSDSMIIQKANELRRCPKDIKNIIGKLQTSENIWTVYYEVISSQSKKNSVYDEMQLKKLDAGIWILECSKTGKPRSYDTFYH